MILIRKSNKNFTSLVKKEFQPIKGLMAATFSKFTENGNKIFMNLGMAIDTENLNLYANDLLK